MVIEAVRDCSAFELSRVDINRPSPHYAVDTMRLLMSHYPGSDLIYLMGGDSLSDLPLWKSCLEFLSYCHTIAVMHRLDDETDLEALEALIPGIAHKLQFIEAPLVDLAASQIRQRVRSGKPFRYFLPSGVYQLIQSKNVYQDPGSQVIPKQ